ncbi:MAG: hypothetical protein ORO03_08735 [Alphaproteobacteria bacterium]|nr:hypothetical protein [Alphaproteobacteria bacterium]
MGKKKAEQSSATASVRARAERAEVKNLARHHTELALETLAEVAQGGSDEKMRLAAAEAILDRGWGKPAPARSGREEGEGSDSQAIILQVETGIRRSRSKKIAATARHDSKPESE